MFDLSGRTGLGRIGRVDWENALAVDFHHGQADRSERKPSVARRKNSQKTVVPEKTVTKRLERPD